MQGMLGKRGVDWMSLPMQTLAFCPNPCQNCDPSWEFEPSYDFLMCEWFCPNCEQRLTGVEEE